MKSNALSMKQIIAMATLAFYLAACHNKDKSKATTTSVSNAMDTVAVFVLHDTSVTKNMELTAELLPYERAELFARVQGYIKEMKVDLGDKVRQGQTLALIEAPELQTKYAEYESSLQAAKATYNSSKDVFQRLQKASQAKTAGIVAPVDLERSRNQLYADSASYQAARKLADSYKQIAAYMVLQAPFDGTVTARNADRGTLVGNGQMVLTIQNNYKLRLLIAVPELYIASNTVSKEVSFRVDAFPEKLFTAPLARKSGAIDPVTRTELWEYMVENRTNELKAGAFAYVKLSLQRAHNSFIVTPGAVVTTQERKFVIRIKNGKTEWVDVRQGMSTDRGIEIFGNLINGDTLAVRATDERKPGSSAYWKITKAQIKSGEFF
ncbi:MAG: efflux RND transporter periplasmic adaptor subunit [Bacteroidota bacterium]